MKQNSKMTLPKCLKRLRFVAAATLMCVAQAVFSQNNSAAEYDTPQKGEGLDAFLLRNGRNLNEHKEDFIKLNSNRFGANGVLLLGVRYRLPLKVEQVTMPIFGADSVVTVQDHALRGATYYLVSGHGGPDPGAIGEMNGHKLHEDEYAYDIMLRLARNVVAHGGKVHIIIQDPDDGIRSEEYLPCDSHETCMGEPIPLGQLDRLKQRSQAINKLYATERKGYCRSIFMHVDSRSQNKKIDIFFYHYMKSKYGERLARVLHSVLDAKYREHQPSRGFEGTVSERDLYVLKATNPPAVFLELGNIQNWRDQKRFILESNRQAIANWLTEGLITDYENN